MTQATSRSATATAVASSQITKARWGKVNGKDITLFTLSNDNGLVMKVANYGGVITQLEVPDRSGKLADIVLGFDDVAGYEKSSPYFGAVIGRVANRISDASFTLEGKQYQLAANNGTSSLHGGSKGWDKVVWNAEASQTSEGPSLTLTYISVDGEEGYPGTVKASNKYTLTDRNVLKIEMEASTDRTTVVNMAHHTYWNLAGHDSGAIHDQELLIHARKYTPADPLSLTVSGEIAPVAGTPFDFTAPKAIGKDLLAAGGDPTGFDTNWVVDGVSHALRAVAQAKDPKSGRVLTLSGDQCGVQFYSGNFLDGSIRGKAGAQYQQYGGFCLETQAHPNSINVPAWRDFVILKPGQPYKSTMLIAFTTE
jgi:aldose 1-epimerase